MRKLTPLKSRRGRLPIVSGANLRLAQLTAGSAFDGAELFPPRRWDELAGFAPQVLVASVSDYQRLIDRMNLRTVEIRSVDHAVFVITAIGDKPLTNPMRAALWQRFLVPVYEVFVDRNSSILASECQLQEGWHIEPGVNFEIDHGEIHVVVRGSRIRTGLSGTVDDAPCDCGSANARLHHSAGLNVQQFDPVLAAIA